MASSLRQKHRWTRCQAHRILLELKRPQYENVDEKAWELPKLRCLGAVVCLCKEVVGKVLGTTRATSRAAKRILISRSSCGRYLKMRLNEFWKKLGTDYVKRDVTKFIIPCNLIDTTSIKLDLLCNGDFSPWLNNLQSIFMQPRFSEVSTISISQWKENWPIQLKWSVITINIQVWCSASFYTAEYVFLLQNRCDIALSCLPIHFFSLPQ